jgi:anti-sigma factor RsiW
MTSPSSRDLERLSAYLDGQLSQSDRTRLENRIKSDPALAGGLEELRQARAFLRRTPQRRAPRNFILTPKMAGIRPPVPRVVPLLSWASAAAMLLFIFTLGAGLVGQLSFGAAATVLSPNTFAGAYSAAPATQAPATVAPVVAAPVPMLPATAVPTAGAASTPTPTEQASIMAVEQATPPPVARAVPLQSAPKAQPKPATIWLYIWSGLAVLLAVLAILIFWLNKRAFQRKNPRS